MIITLIKIICLKSVLNKKEGLLMDKKLAELMEQLSCNDYFVWFTNYYKKIIFEKNMIFIFKILVIII